MERRNNNQTRGTRGRGSRRGNFRGNRGTRGVPHGSVAPRGNRGRGGPRRGVRSFWRPPRGDRGMKRPIRGNVMRGQTKGEGNAFLFSNRDETNNHNNKNNNGIHFSFDKIKEIINKDDNEIIQYLMNFKDLTEAFNNTQFSIKMFDLFTELLLKISKINSMPASNSLYQILKNTNYNRMAKQRLAKEEYNNEKYLSFINNLILLNDKLIDKYTDDLIRIKYGELSEYVDIIKEMNNQQLAKDIEINLKKLKEKETHKKLIEVEQKQKEREQNIINEDNSDMDKIPIDYKDRNIYLSYNDLMENDELKIAPHLKSGSYRSYERYINTMFYLEYQDCYMDLKNTIRELNKSVNNLNIKELYQLSKDYSNIYFYLEGEIKGLDLDRDGAIITIEFKTHYNKRIKFTKRMITGSLIILTDNNFENYLLTTVYLNPYVDRKINENPKQRMWLPKFPYYRVKLSLININTESFAFLIKNRQHLQIFESKAYFESYVYVMKRLKELSIPDLPFKNELVDADFSRIKIRHQNESNYLIYYHKNKQMILSPYLKRYSIDFQNMFDKSQLKAIHNSLLNRIALIQGPPGTGKTYVGTILTNILLQNISKDAQILIVCFTNHALDSFIEDILNYTDDIVRIGGRCQNEKVAEHILKNKYKYSSIGYKSTVKQLDEIGENLENITSLIDNRRRVAFGDVKRNFKELFDRVVNDFINIMKEVLVKECGKSFNQIDDKIKREIYFFWNLLDYPNKKNKPDNIVYQLLNYLNIDNENFLNKLYNLILNNFKGYDVDNLDLLKKLNNNEKIEEEEKEEIKIEINIPNQKKEDEEKKEENEIIIDNSHQQNEEEKKDEIENNKHEQKNLEERKEEKKEENDNNIININNEDKKEEKKEENEINIQNKQNEEEEEEDDEDEILQNLDRINYQDIDLENNKNEINNEDELYEESLNDLTKLKPLDDQKYNSLINSKINFFKLGPKIIKLIISYMKDKLLATKLDINNDDLGQFSYLLDKKKEIISMSDAEAIKQYKIVAMTTTGAAKYSTILEQSNFEVIIIEEAAEVLESHVLSLLTKNTKRLILIGDHKQLKPKPYNYDLETKYNFNVSIFERLINNNIPYSSLKFQRRMKPKFADFVRIIYGEAEYQDHENVLNRENVRGIESDMYFITHNRYEGENAGLKSKFNDYEAKYLAKLCKYLLQQQYDTNQITILTFYLGQVMLIKKYLKENLNEDIVKQIRVSSVDNYQGEECDIILLSLVRSNRDFKIGFLKTFNRVCVAFSRAKIGLYIIGNIDCIIKGEKIRQNKNKNKKYTDIKMLDVWQRIEAKAKELNIIGNKLTLICKNHKNKTIIENEKDFAKCPEGGCQEICKIRKKCGHVCEKVCHVYECDDIKCLKPCVRINKNCEQIIQHRCTKLCWQDCGKCEYIVDKTLPCRHVQKNMKCYQKPKKCEVLVEKLLSCGHSQMVKCCENPKPCREIVTIRLICGHSQKVICRHPTKPCEELVYKTLPCGHRQKLKCCEQPKICEELVDKTLKCGHIQKNLKCYQKTKPCEELVDKTLECGHIQKNVKCYAKPKPCKELVNKELPCGHTKELCYCFRDPKNILCEKNCMRKMKCGHPCKLKCHENCEEQLCHERIFYKLKLCNHINNIECYLSKDPLKIICQEPCLAKLPCGHICPGTCGRCLKGTLHIMCNQKCLNKLICGHSCNQECSSECMCEEIYDKICLHKKNEENCYEINQNCTEICNRECRHSFCMKKCNEICNRKTCNKRCENIMKCGHQCYGLCGEICPEICLICDGDSKDIKTNKEKEEFFYKTFCGHVFPVKEIDEVFNKKNIEIYKCPECKKPLLLELRYKDKISSFLTNIRAIKNESYDKNNGINNNYYSNEIKKIIIDKLIDQYNSGKINAFDMLSKYKINYKSSRLKERMPIIFNLIKNFNSQNIQKNFSLYNLITLAERFMGIEYYAFQLNQQTKLERNDFDFLKNFNEVKQYFEPKTIQFNRYFFKELKRKIDNMIYYVVLRIVDDDENNSGFLPGFFSSKKITTNDIAKSYFSLDLTLRDLYLSSLDLNDKVIFKSLSSKWYKCPNNHFYTAEEIEKYDDSCPHCTFGEKAFSMVKNIFGF